MMKLLFSVLIACTVSLLAACGPSGRVKKESVKNITPASQPVKKEQRFLSYFGEKSYPPEGRDFSGEKWSDNGPKQKVDVKLKVARLRKISYGAIFKMTFEIKPQNPKQKPGEDNLYFYVDDEKVFYLSADEANTITGFDESMNRIERVRCRRSPSECSDGMYENTIKVDPAVCEFSSLHPGGHYTVIKWANNRGLIEYSCGYGAGRDGFSFVEK